MEAQQILVVDDNEGLLDLLRMALEREGYDVLTAHSAREALQLIDRYGVPHLALLDINMPEMDGFQLGRTIRESSNVPIIYLTAVNREQAVVEGLRKYADDYILKPFHMDELVARVRRVLRRVSDFQYRTDPVIRIDDYLQLDLDEQEAYVGGERTGLTPTESKLLEILVNNRGRVVPTERLLERVWPREDPSEDRLYVAVYRLRQKLRGPEGDWDYIATRPGLGYIFVEREA